jgi:hypothetical protein
LGVVADVDNDPLGFTVTSASMPRELLVSTGIVPAASENVEK